MRRAALAVVLSLCLPVSLLAQHSGGHSGGHGSGSSGGSHGSGSSGSHSNSGHASSSVKPSGSTTRSENIPFGGHGGHPIISESQSQMLLPVIQTKRGTPHALVPGASSASTSASGTSFQEPIRLHHENGDMNKALREGKFDADLRQFGLQPTKEAYQAKLASLGETDKTLAKKPNWFAKAFLGKPDVNGEARRPKPCKHCKPAPRPPSRPPVAGGTGFCYGYIERCDHRGNCYAHLRPVDYSSCDDVLRQLKQEEALAANLKTSQQSSCSADARSADCGAKTAALQNSESSVTQLRDQYKMCIMAASSVSNLRDLHLPEHQPASAHPAQVTPLLDFVEYVSP